MRRRQWYYKLIDFVTVLLVASILPLSCIAHCHAPAPLQSATPNLFVCHPFYTIDNESPQHVHAHAATLRATHEVALPVSMLMAVIVVGHSLRSRHLWYSEWVSSPSTPPPRI